MGKGKHVCPPMFAAKMYMQVMMSDQGLSDICQNKKHEKLLKTDIHPLKYH